MDPKDSSVESHMLSMIRLMNISEYMEAVCKMDLTIEGKQPAQIKYGLRNGMAPIHYSLM